MAGCGGRLGLWITTQIRLKSSKLSIDSARLSFLRCQSTMAQKLIYSEYGDPVKVLRKVEDNLPAPKDNQILVRILAAPVNPADINTIQGVYAIKPKLPSVPGNEGVGEVLSVGATVTSLKKGDLVLPKGLAWGTWRSHALCDANDMLKVPDSLGVVEAATLAINPCTAYRMLNDFVKISPGATVIQNGANSAVGQNVIQLCCAWGFNSVNIVRNRPNISELKDFLTNLGATHVLTEEELRSSEIFKKGVLPKPKLALNSIGGQSALQVLRQLDEQGVMVTYGGMSREPVTVPTSALIFKDLTLHGFWMTRWTKQHVDSAEQRKMFEDLAELIRCGKLKPPLHKMVPFSNYEEAVANTLSAKGFHGVKYILDFQKDSCIH